MALKKQVEKPHREKLYTIDEMASMLKVEKRTLVEWVQHRRIPYVRVDEKLIRFRVSDIVQWVKKNRQQSGHVEKFSLR